MYIAIIADDNKKELMAQFCIAYCGILCRHHIFATYSTGSYIADATGLDIETFLPGSTGGMEQIISRVSYNEIDLVFYFRGTEISEETSDVGNTLLRLCDVYNIPIATNLASAEVMVTALEAGSFNWRDLVNPMSEYNQKKKRRI